jgi:hypothetical protein
MIYSADIIDNLFFFIAAKGDEEGEEYRNTWLA